MTDGYSLAVRREIAAPAEVLFDAWLNAESLGSWLRPGGTRETRAETDPRVGGTFRIVMVDDDSSMLHTGTYREIDRLRRLVFTWSSPATGFRDSVVTVTFHASWSNSTLVEIHQVGLPDAFIRDGDRVFRTYFINVRGDEALGSTWSYLDMTALGRQEEWEDSPEGYPQTPPYEWWSWHDEPAAADPA